MFARPTPACKFPRGSPAARAALTKHSAPERAVPAGECAHLACAIRRRPDQLRKSRSSPCRAIQRTPPSHTRLRLWTAGDCFWFNLFSIADTFLSNPVRSETFRDISSSARVQTRVTAQSPTDPSLSHVWALGAGDETLHTVFTSVCSVDVWTFRERAISNCTVHACAGGNSRQALSRILDGGDGHDRRSGEAQF